MFSSLSVFFFFFFNDTATTEIYTLSLHDALPIYTGVRDVLDGEPHAEARVELQADAEMGAELQRSRQAVGVVVDGVRQQVGAEACLDISLRRATQSGLRSPDPGDIHVEPEIGRAHV